MRRMRKQLRVSKIRMIGTALLAWSAVAAAQGSDGSEIMQSWPATMLKSVVPEYPPDELQRQRQGWVRLSYVVTTDGTVVDPIIEDSGGSREFERSALSAVIQWIYEPATRNGESTEQSFTGVMVTFSSNDSKITMSGAFNRRYRDINRSLVARELEEVDRLINDAFDNFSLNIADLARLWMLRGRHAQEVGDDELQLASYRKAVVNGGEWINDGDYRRLMTSIVSLELSAGDYSSALTHYEALVDKTGDGTVPANIRRAFDTAHRQIEKYEILAVPARLSTNDQCDDCAANWQYAPLRRELAINNIRGSLHNIEIRCEWQRVVDEAREGIVWTLPEEWGKCRVIVYGDKGTIFDLHEIEPALRDL